MDEETRARQEQERQALLDKHAADAHQEAVQEERRDKRRLVALAIILPLSLLAIWLISRGLPAWRVARGERVAAEQTLQRRGVSIPGTDFRGPTQPGGECVLAIGPVGRTPTATRIAMSPDTAVTVVARCPAGVQMVDLIVTGPPEVGVLGLVTAKLAAGSWTWEGLLPLPPGSEVRFWPWADGMPAGAPVTLTTNP